MAKFQLELPTIQNWSCHNCSGCCRQHQIEITEEERQRIEKQGWEESEDIPDGQPVIVPLGSKRSQRHRLAHQPDGACVFLREDGLCRIHAKFGEAAKPLACLVYPYALHPSGPDRKNVTVSLRYSCPSVVGNKGKTVKEAKPELLDIASQVVPNDEGSQPPPRLTKKDRTNWHDFRKFVTALDTTFAREETPLVQKIHEVLTWVDLVTQSSFEKLKGERIDEYLELVTQAATAEVEATPQARIRPSRTGRTLYRLHCAQYARKDTALHRNQGWKGRWFLLIAALRFTSGRGNVPPLQPAFQPVPFAILDGSFGELPQSTDELFSRYFRVKIQGLHFCGPAFYKVPFTDGVHSLMLMFPVILWLARWLAAGENRNTLTLADIELAMTIADHHHGYSPALGTSSALRRVRLLHQLGDVPRLVNWYAM